MSLSFRTVALPGPFDLLAALPDDSGFAFVQGGCGLAGWGEAARAASPAELEELLADCAVDDPLRRPGSGPVAFFSLPFDGTPESAPFVVPEIVLGYDGRAAWATVAGGAPVPELRPRPLPALPRIRYAGSSIAEVAWLEAVAKAIELIRAHALDKVVLARDLRVWSKERIDLRSVAAALAARFKECYVFSIDGLVGASPELLAGRRGAYVRSLVLAGSAPRGADGGHDERLGAELLASPKDEHEHELSVGSVVPVLGRHCRALTVGEPELLRLANVQHIATWVQGKLDSGASALRLALELHPTAAVCGAPAASALEVIRALEGFDRGRYAGPVGWVDARGDGDVAIALRCAEFDAERGRLFAGAGIVSGSVPEAELEETRLKLRAMQSALDPG